MFANQEKNTMGLISKYWFQRIQTYAVYGTHRSNSPSSLPVDFLGLILKVLSVLEPGNDTIE